MYRNKLTKTDYINLICKLDEKWDSKRGRLYYLTISELKKIYRDLKGVKDVKI